jgi:biotin carboxyl carrier protein
MKNYRITVNGVSYEVTVEEIDGSNGRTPVYSTPVAPAAVSTPKAAPTGVAGMNKVIAPMPGTILDVKVSVGQSVKKGDVVCVLEAMKMENDIPAPCDGVITSINVQKGSTVAANDVLVSLN